MFQNQDAAFDVLSTRNPEFTEEQIFEAMDFLFGDDDSFEPVFIVDCVRDHLKGLPKNTPEPSSVEKVLARYPDARLELETNNTYTLYVKGHLALTNRPTPVETWNAAARFISKHN